MVKLFWGQKARRYWLREKQGAQWLAAAGVATPRLQLASPLENGLLALVFECLDPAESAARRWQRSAHEAEKKEVLSALFGLTGQCHQHGCFQSDLHLDNFLFSGDRLYAIDGDGMRQPGASDKPLSPRNCVRNLALFIAQLPLRDEKLALSCLPDYLQKNPLPPDWLATVLAKAINRARRRRRHAYIQKSTRSCTEFVSDDSFLQHSVYRRDGDGPQLQAFLADPDGYMRQGTLLKDGNSATVVRVGDWVIKRYNLKNLVHAISRGLRPTRAWISWRNAHRLKASAIDTPEAIAVVEKRFGLWRRTGYYVTRAAQGHSAENLTEISPSAQCLAELFQLFYRLKIYHGDCKASNFLVTGNQVEVIDLDAMGECRYQWRYLHHYRKDRKRFLRNWPKDSELGSYFDQHLP
ncbi:MAG: hypothetical protein JXR59_07825 [Desulfuromonadaceae bacterium]|nr:hypothetical protein [Desulfuromonadaceae bacterium]